MLMHGTPVSRWHDEQEIRTLQLADGMVMITVRRGELPAYRNRAEQCGDDGEQPGRSWYRRAEVMRNHGVIRPLQHENLLLIP